MEEQKWFNVSIYLQSKSEPIEVSMIEKELDELKLIKLQGRRYYFQTHHESSDRLLVDVTQIQAITETVEYGDY